MGGVEDPKVEGYAWLIWKYKLESSCLPGAGDSPRPASASVLLASEVNEDRPPTVSRKVGQGRKRE